ncbi:iron chelate uptake ABC transporter family permease subunit [Micromonospora sp. WMMD1082]|uniref:FecCD family ABC transporter permease n=1 Tax=Micromonospora sp. WMMD1082 TaxID=3016104 RepID=UPI002417F3FD|nr:iron chelate uptake ABC transporter family permease subunit [Micromonospora sp. WMMD1082]MDG4795651.1 iron chelate uptake ABC transporter family permease subunit [Micromonospora sp. WMMD1082]
MQLVDGAADVAAPQRRAAARPATRHSLPLLSGLVVAVAVLATVAIASVSVGAKPIGAGDVFASLLAYDPADGDHLVVRTLRVPRTVVGLLAGMALGLSGAIMQGLTRNPLADPGLLGVNAGAALFVVTGISLFGVTTLTGYVWFAFVGAAVTAVVVYGIAAFGRDGATPVKLALAGAAVSAALASVTTALLLTDTDAFDHFRLWQVGSLAGRGTDLAGQALPFMLAGVLLALPCGRLLNTLSLGDDVARGLGQNVAATRVLGALCVVVLCGTATALAGPVAFVGLAVPHVARLITGPDYRWILPYAMVLAPTLLLAADVVGRVLARPAEVQVGVVTAVIGAPAFIALVRRRKLAEL